MLPYVLTLLLSGLQTASVDGTWELTRIFRAGPAPATRTVPIDSTVYLRLTLRTMPGDWIDGRLYRRYFGKEERTKIEAGPARGAGRPTTGAGLERPGPPEDRPAAWLIGDTLRLGTPFVPDADSLELKRVRAEQPSPTTVIEVVTTR